MKIRFLFACLILTSVLVHAEISLTLTATTDYTFNGVSQTSNDPALQLSFDKSFDNGSYMGAWGSNVDFDNYTTSEWDIYLGQAFEVSKSVTTDIGIAYYSYHGDKLSSQGNYFEVYSKWLFTSNAGNTEVNFWYSWDYFGSGASHVITQISHSVEFLPEHSLVFTIDSSNSLDGDKYLWDVKQKSYQHFQVAYQTQFSGLDITLAAETTNLNWHTADERVVLSLSKTFEL